MIAAIYARRSTPEEEVTTRERRILVSIVEMDRYDKVRAEWWQAMSESYSRRVRAK